MYRWGFDKYQVHTTLHELTRMCYAQDIAIYHVCVKDTITFYAKVHQRNKIQSTLSGAKRLHRVGFLGILTRWVFSIHKWVVMLACVCMFYVLNHLMFSYQVYGDVDALDVEIEQVLSMYQYRFIDVEAMKKSIMEQCGAHIQWLEVYPKGNHIDVRYKAREEVEEQSYNNDALIAKKDGLLVCFDVQSGYKVTQINQSVKAGDILVDNVMPNSFGSMVHVDVVGKVYAHTWNRVSVEMQDTVEQDDIALFVLLMEARGQIQLEGDEEKIVAENILLFERKEDKIILEVLFTLYEDITS